MLLSIFYYASILFHPIFASKVIIKKFIVLYNKSLKLSINAKKFVHTNELIKQLNVLSCEQMIDMNLYHTVIKTHKYIED